MFKIEVANVRELNEKECTALGMMFMHLAGHSVHGVDDGHKSTGFLDQTTQTAQSLKAMSDALRLADSCENNPANYPASETNPIGFPVPIPSPQEDLESFLIEEELIHVGPEAVTTPSPFEEYDSAGIKWDDRIHAKNRSKTANGIWKLGRNLSPDMVKKVMKELRARSVSPVMPPVIPVPPVMPPVIPVPPVMPPVIPVPPVMPPVIPQEDAFEVLMGRVMTGVAEKKTTIAAISQLVRSFKDANGEPVVSTLGLVGTQPQLIPLINAELDKVLI